MRGLVLCLLLAGCDTGESIEVRTGPTRPRPFLKQEKEWYVWDSVIGHVHKPDARRDYVWPEHADQKFVMRSNNLGFREDEPTSESPEQGSVRVLVTGDSNLDGVLNNHESFPNVLETLLNANGGERRFEVINGGTGYYGVQHYTRFLQKYATLKPELFIVVLYTGNDLLDAARRVEQKREIKPGRPPDYVEKLLAARQGKRAIVGQALNQIYYMRSLPEMAEETMDFVRREFREMQRLCKKKRIELLVVLWPSLIDTQPWLDAERIAAARAELGLAEEGLELNRELTVGLAADLAQHGIEVIDLYEAMRSDPEACFWLQDYHVNVRGHRLTAEVVFEHWSAGFQRLGRR